MFSFELFGVWFVTTGRAGHNINKNGEVTKMKKTTTKVLRENTELQITLRRGKTYRQDINVGVDEEGNFYIDLLSASITVNSSHKGSVTNQILKPKVGM